MNIGSLSLRRPAAGDEARIAKFARRAFDEAFSGYPENRPEDMASYMDEAFSVEAIRSELENASNVYLLAEVDEEIVGYAKLAIGATEECIEAEKPIELARLYCASESIGRGVGKALMQECLKFAVEGGHDVMWLGVWTKNFRAQEFYKQFGFTKCGEHVFVLGSDPQTDWVMSRSLKENAV